jgi:hypothetical protein
MLAADCAPMAYHWRKLVALHRIEAHKTTDPEERLKHLRTALRLARLVRQIEAIGVSGDFTPRKPIKVQRTGLATIDP